MSPWVGPGRGSGSGLERLDLRSWEAFHIGFPVPPSSSPHTPWPVPGLQTPPANGRGLEGPTQLSSCCAAHGSGRHAGPRHLCPHRPSVASPVHVHGRASGPRPLSASGAALASWSCSQAGSRPHLAAWHQLGGPHPRLQSVGGSLEGLGSPRIFPAGFQRVEGSS